MLNRYPKIFFYIIAILILGDIIVFGAVFDNHNDLKISALNIGQGDSILIESPTGNTMLIDGGPDNSVLANLNTELGFLRRRINFLMVSNPDKDHIEGFIDILRRYKVDAVILPGTISKTETYQAFLKEVEKSGSKIFLARRGERIDFTDGVFMDILFPDRNPSLFDTNTGSIVAKLYYGDTSVLFTGDAPGEVEEYVALVDKDLVKSDVLKVAHHGSKHSSFLDFLKQVQPKYAVISDGVKNKYGHPHKEALENLSLTDTKILRTDLLGTVRLLSDGVSFRQI
jgi:competence protein ComEC